MAKVFAEIDRVLTEHGVCAVMFAHKTTTAWEALICGLLRSGLVVTGSWPLHTEMKTRMRAMASAALASSVTLVCRKRMANASSGLWDDVRQELKEVANERLDFFWNQGIRGADFFISAIGPALSVFGKYEQVTKLSGEEVTVGQFLDEVRSLVTNYALTKILHTTHTASIDPESRFYVVWQWSYGDASVPADESFKLSQALGMHTEAMWDRTGVLEKSGENVQAVPIAKRMRVKSLGEPIADGTPASLIDVLHRMCAFREKGDTQGMAQFLGQSGHANNPTLWLIAQAISEILPDGDKEKQLMQGLLNQREGLEEATRQRTLF
jgi:adenine-specific DNA methylase